MEKVKTFKDLKPGDKVYVGNYNWDLPNVLLSKYELIIESSEIVKGKDNTDVVKFVFNKNISDNVPRKDLYVIPEALSWSTITNKDNLDTVICINSRCLL